MKHKFLASVVVGVVMMVACEASAPRLSSTQERMYNQDYGPAILAAGNNNNWSDGNCPGGNSTVACYFYGDSSGSTITGIDQAVYGNQFSIYWLWNQGPYPITVAHNSGSSSADNRIHTRTGADVIIAPGYGIAISALTDWSNGMNFPLGWWQISLSGVDSVVHSTPSRTLGTAFQPSLSRLTHVCYSVKVDTVLTLTGGQEGRIEILSDSANPPTVIRGSAPGRNTGTVVVGMTMTNSSGGSLCAMVPPKDYVLLRGVNVTGTPTYTITQQVEDLL